LDNIVRFMGAGVTELELTDAATASTFASAKADEGQTRSGIV
jgi:hypothetical protein